MTDAEKQIARALSTCSFGFATGGKRFCRNLAAAAVNRPDAPLSELQSANLFRLAYRYRRQLPATIVSLALDEIEAAAHRRVQNGLPALARFSRPRGAARSKRVQAAAAAPPESMNLPLFPDL